MSEEEKPKRREVSLDTRLKMRQKKLENPVRFWSGKTRPPMNQETKDKIRAKLKGRPLLPEHKKNMAEGKRKMFEERKELLNKIKEEVPQNSVQSTILPGETKETTGEE